MTSSLNRLAVVSLIEIRAVGPRPWIVPGPGTAIAGLDNSIVAERLPHGVSVDVLYKKRYRTGSSESENRDFNEALKVQVFIFLNSALRI